MQVQVVHTLGVGGLQPRAGVPIISTILAGVHQSAGKERGSDA